MSLMNIKKYWEIDGVVEFVYKFNMEKEFKELIGVDIDKWNYEDSDDEIIDSLLEKKKGKYVYFYDELKDKFIIIEVRRMKNKKIDFNVLFDLRKR